MTKQEEIREGMAEGLFKFDHPYEEWGVQPAHEKLCYRHRSAKALYYLHSQGVVIKRGKELPASLTIAQIRQRYTELGYVAVESLIKEE